jgi:hypothetical protein
MREADNSPVCGVEVKNAWSYTSASGFGFLTKYTYSVMYPDHFTYFRTWQGHVSSPYELYVCRWKT